MRANDVLFSFEKKKKINKNKIILQADLLHTWSVANEKNSRG